MYILSDLSTDHPQDWHRLNTSELRPLTSKLEERRRASCSCMNIGIEFDLLWYLEDPAQVFSDMTALSPQWATKRLHVVWISTQQAPWQFARLLKKWHGLFDVLVGAVFDGCLNVYFCVFYNGRTLFSEIQTGLRCQCSLWFFFEAWPRMEPWSPKFGRPLTSLPCEYFSPLHGWPKMVAESPDSLEASRLPTCVYGFLREGTFSISILYPGCFWFFPWSRSFMVCMFFCQAGPPEDHNTRPNVSLSNQGSS